MRIPVSLLPITAMVVVAIAASWASRTPSQWVARVYSGPTEGRTRLSFRLELRRWPLASQGALEQGSASANLPVSLSIRDGRGQRATWSGTAKRGMADPVVRFDAPVVAPLSMRLGVAGEVAAAGEFSVSEAAWSGESRPAGGWLEGSRSGVLAVDVAAERGAMAVPFPERLVVRVFEGEVPVVAKLRLAGEGLKFVRTGTQPLEGGGRSAVAQLEASTDQRGRLVAWATAFEGVALLTVRASAQAREGAWHGRLPAVMGASQAVVAGGMLRLSSPIARERLFYAIVNHRERWVGGAVELKPAPGGRARGEVPWVAPPEGPWWVVVSSDVGLASSSALGWPIRERREHESEPLQTLTLRESLVLDGAENARADVQARRRSVVLWAGFWVVLTMILSLGSALRLVHGAQRRLEEHLVEAGDRELASSTAERPRFPLALLLLSVCMMLGYAGVAIWLLGVFG